MRSVVKAIIVTFLILTVMSMFSVAAAYFYFTRTALPISLAYKAEGVKVDEEWTISFGREVALTDTPQLVPHLEGVWYRQRGLFGIQSLSFRPSEPFVKGVRYIAHIPLARAYDEQETIVLPRIIFSTESASVILEDISMVTSSFPIGESIHATTTLATSTPATSTVKKAYSPEVFKLDVPYFKQEYSRSCEASSLRMVLAYYGITTHDMDILQKIGYAPRPKDKENNVWDDPHEMFVGDASKDNGEGYGVYGEPVVKAANSFGKEAEYATKITAQYLAQHVRAGHPVILWGYLVSAGPEVRWNTPSGGEVIAIADEHARVVVGVLGTAKNPVGFYLHDPRSEEPYEYWSKENLMAHIGAVPGVTNQAVVVK